MGRKPLGNVYIYPYGDGFRCVWRQRGKQHASPTVSTRKEAEDLAADIRLEIAQQSQTVRGAWDAYSEARRMSGTFERSIKTSEEAFARIAGSVWNSPLAALTLRMCEQLYASCAQRFGVGTQRLSLVVAKSFGRWCASPKRRWLVENPFDAIEPIGRLPDHRGESLRREEARELRETCLRLGRSGDAGAVAVLLVLMTSLRPNEVVQICARDVDDGVLWIDGRVKHENSRRQIDIADVELLELLVALAADRAPSDRIFPHHRNWVTRQVKRIVGSSNSRELRRTFSALSARRGLGLDAVALSMGHGADGNARTAQRHYMSAGSAQSGAAARVSNALSGSRELPVRRPAGASKKPPRRSRPR